VGFGCMNPLTDLAILAAYATALLALAAWAFNKATIEE